MCVRDSHCKTKGEPRTLVHRGPALGPAPSPADAPGAKSSRGRCGPVPPGPPGPPTPRARLSAVQCRRPGTRSFRERRPLGGDREDAVNWRPPLASLPLALQPIAASQARIRSARLAPQAAACPGSPDRGPGRRAAAGWGWAARLRRGPAPGGSARCCWR